MQIACTQCGTPIDVRDLPQPEIMNTPNASVIVLSHPKPSFCLGCKSKVAVLIQGANLHLAAVPVREPSPIVTAASMPKIAGKG